jgi:hypothetical protein
VKWKNPTKQSDTLTLEDLYAAMNQIYNKGTGTEPDYIVIHPKDLASLKKDVHKIMGPK